MRLRCYTVSAGVFRPPGFHSRPPGQGIAQNKCPKSPQFFIYSRGPATPDGSRATRHSFTCAKGQDRYRDDGDKDDSLPRQDYAPSYDDQETLSLSDDRLAGKEGTEATQNQCHENDKNRGNGMKLGALFVHRVGARLVSMSTRSSLMYTWAKRHAGNGQGSLETFECLTTGPATNHSTRGP